MNSAIKLVAMSLAVAVTSPAGAVTMTTSAPATQNNNIVQIAQGCPAGMWRGPWGHCRDTPYSGPLPNNTWVGILLLPSTIWVTDVLPVCGMVHGVIVATLLIKEGFLTVSGKTKPTSFNLFYREQEI